MKSLNCGIFGFFFHLEYDANNFTTELRFVLDSEKGLFAIPLHYKDFINDALNDAYETAKNNADFSNDISFPATLIDEQAKDLMPLLSLVIYLCSENQDTVLNSKPLDPGQRFPIPKKTKQGFRLFPPDKPSFYEVGFNISKKLRLPNNSESTIGSFSPRPHIRRAHWHTFLAGPKNMEREKRIKWLPPISVGINDSDEVIPKILKVK